MDTPSNTSKVERNIHRLMKISRVLLLVSSAASVVSIVSQFLYYMRFFGIENSPDEITWPSLIFSIYALSFSFIVLLVSAIHFSIIKPNAWPWIKKDVLTFLLTSVVFILFIFVLRND